MTVGRLPVLLISMLALVAAVNAGSLEDLRWKNRVVLVFGPTENELVEKQRAELEADPEGLQERDIVMISVIDSPGRAGLEQRFKVPSDTFVVILIGKDGGEKLRTSAFLPNAELFAVIDSMPMRQQEIRKRKE